MTRNPVMNDVHKIVSGAVTVATGIGTLRLRTASDAEAAALAALSATSDESERWRSWLATVASRDSADGTAGLVSPDDLQRLTDEDLDRCADAYLTEVLDIGTGAASGGAVPPREDGERASHYAARVLASRAPRRPSARGTTIERLVADDPDSGPSPSGDDGRTEASLGEHDATSSPISPDDAMADAQRRVEEIRTLLKERDADREATGDLDVAATVESPISAEPTSTEVDATPAQYREAPARNTRREWAMLSAAVDANRRGSAQLGAIAETLSASLSAAEEDRRRLQTTARRGIVAVVGVLIVSCVLSALALVQNHLRDRAIDVRNDALKAQVEAGKGMQDELARLRDERAGFVSRIEKLEADAATMQSESAKAAENARAAEAAKAAATDSTKAAKATKGAKSSRPTRAPAR